MKEEDVNFTHESMPQRVTFATGRAPTTVVSEVRLLRGSRVMLIASERDRHLADPVAQALSAAGVSVALRHEEVVMHVPLDVVRRARSAAASAGADIVVCVGGGSTTGLGKAVVMKESPVAGLPLIAVPTTFAGSEATNVWGMTHDERKTTGTDPRALPASVVYDATLLTSLPAEMVVASGLNALAHSVDSMWGPHADPIDRALAGEGIVGVAAGLTRLATEPGSLEGIEQTLYGAYLAGVSFSSAGSGMHHKICHVLGGMFNLPHAHTHAVVLPHVLAYNAPHAPDAARRVAAALDTPTAVEGLADLHRRLGAPTSLKDYGMPESGIDEAVPRILEAVPANNPTPVTDESLTALLRAAWEGTLP